MSASTHDAAHSSAKLTVDLGAVAANYLLLKRKSAPALCGAAVKANAYGLGAAPVTRALAAAGCRHFFVAHPGEGVELRSLRDVQIERSAIYVMGGLSGEPASLFTTYDLVPVLTTREDIVLWRRHALTLQRRLPALLHFDTGINRMGLAFAELAAISQESFASFDIHYVMSHLACADEPDHPLNEEQRKRFDLVRARFPDLKASLANSSGIFLGPAYHYDLTRPGAALYGVNPTPAQPNPMQGVVTLEAPVLQVRVLAKNDTVGYGATYRAGGPMRIATIGLGYADGYLRALSGRGAAVIAGHEAPVLGRVSMDLVTLDVTAIDEGLVQVGTPAQVIGPQMPVDEVARRAGTIGYEILTMLGPRYARAYEGLAGNQVS